ncbi:MAG: hypothetical protein ACUVSF_13660 [Anaerolineae bacterium]
MKRESLFNAGLTVLGLVLLVLLSALNGMPTVEGQNGADDRRILLPLVLRSGPSTPSSTEWTQFAHDT